MRDDRIPRHAVIVDEDASAEEMEVTLSIKEIKLFPEIELQKCERVEPWLRIRRGDQMYVSFGVTAVPFEDDLA